MPTTARVTEIVRNLNAGVTLLGLCPRRADAVVSVGVNQTAVGDGGFAVWCKGDREVFASPLAAAVHFIAMTEPAAVEDVRDDTAVELESLVVLDFVSAPWPMRMGA